MKPSVTDLTVFVGKIVQEPAAGARGSAITVQTFATGETRCEFIMVLLERLNTLLDTALSAVIIMIYAKIKFVAMDTVLSHNRLLS